MALTDNRVWRAGILLVVVALAAAVIAVAALQLRSFPGAELVLGVVAGVGVAAAFRLVFVLVGWLVRR